MFGHYLGSLGHADDIQSISPNLDLLELQAGIVDEFTKTNDLNLNVNKLELQEFSKSKQQPPCSMQIFNKEMVMNKSVFAPSKTLSSKPTMTLPGIKCHHITASPCSLMTSTG